MSTSTRARGKKPAAPPPGPPPEVEAGPVQAPALPLGSVQMIPLTLIDPDPANVRETEAGPEADAALRASIAQLGLLEPPTVRPHPDDPARFLVKMGHRRIAACKALGMQEARCILVIGGSDDDGERQAVQAAENMVRAAMHPVDAWKTVASMTSTGSMDRRAAFLALGIGARRGALLERLGRIDGEVLEAIAKIPAAKVEDMPQALHIISTAPIEDQRKAWKKVSRAVAFPDVHVRDLAVALQRKTVSSAAAIFPIDGSKLAWTEDLFAQPDDPGRFSTDDIAGFLREQQAALTAAAKAEADAGHPIEVAKWDEKTHRIAVPAGWAETYRDGSKPAPKGGKGKVLTAVVGSGWQIGKVVRAYVEPVAKPAKGSKGSQGAGTKTVEPRPPMTQKGLNLVADAKAEAIRSALAWEDDPWRIIGALLIAMGSDNIIVQGDPAGVEIPWTGYNRNRLADLAIDVASAGPGAQGEDYRAMLLQHARAAIARVTIAPAPKRFRASGPAADWLGAMLGAAAHLPRLDDEAFLREASGEALRDACRRFGKTAGKKGDMVKALAGAAPGWCPIAQPFAVPTAEQIAEIAKAKAERPSRFAPEAEGDEGDPADDMDEHEAAADAEAQDEAVAAHAAEEGGAIFGGDGEGRADG